MTVAFDTLKLADRLESAGMPTQQAKGVAAALAETATADLVTREYLDLRLSELETRLRGDIGDVESRMQGKIATIHGEIAAARGEIAAIHGEIAAVHAEMAGMATKAELSEAKAEILRWIRPSSFSGPSSRSFGCYTEILDRRRRTQERGPMKSLKADGRPFA